MYRIGLTGGIGSGKSTIADMFAQFGAYVLKADKLGHEVLTIPNQAYFQTVSAFGTEILNADHTINRKALGQIVFNDTEKLALLEAIVHPAVQALCKQRVDAANPSIFVYEVATLFEHNMENQFDHIIAVETARDVQIARAMKRDGASRDKILTRLDKQLQVRVYQSKVSTIVDGNLPMESLLLRVKNLWHYLSTIAVPEHEAKCLQSK